MYFLSDEEHRFLVGRLLPQARREQVHPELRGWSWREPPLAPVYNVPLGVYEIAAQYCGTGRDVFLRRVLGIRARPNRAMREGAALHAALKETILRAKQAIYAGGTEGCLRRLAELASPSPTAADPPTTPPEESPELGLRIAALRQFEYHRVISRVQEVLAHQPRVGTDSLATLAVPVTVEQQLDGSLLGLSGHLATDALLVFTPLVFDVKFGPRRDFHRLATTAYALVLESLYECPVDVGCIVYVAFDGDRILVQRDLHLLDDELRQWFVDERDERSRRVTEEIDPGKAVDCAEDCPYIGHCAG